MVGVINRRAILAASAGLLAFGCADGPIPQKGPLIVVLDQNPWLMALGSDSPIFALYGDGTVIFQKGEGYRSVALKRRELNRLLSDLALPGLPPFAKHYALFPGTDAPTTCIFVFEKQRGSVISVYGGLAAEGSRAQMPAQVVSTYDRARKFDHPDARPWLPAKIEVIIWPYDYAPEPSIVWPAKWPGLHDPSTARRGDDGYNIYVPSADYGELKAFLATENEKGAVEIGGKKWAASVRLPFPDERTWMSLRPAVEG
jgi:hypothetical protein